jgi:hypothetical protein
VVKEALKIEFSLITHLSKCRADVCAGKTARNYKGNRACRKLGGARFPGTSKMRKPPLLLALFPSVVTSDFSLGFALC